MMTLSIIKKTLILAGLVFLQSVYCGDVEPNTDPPPININITIDRERIVKDSNNDNSKKKVNEFPEPPTEDSTEPERLVRYFCKAWKNEDFNLMYGAMHTDYRDQVRFKEFKELFIKDNKRSGGLRDEKIPKNADALGGNITLIVHLHYNNKTAGVRKVKATLTKTPRGYRLIKSGILPVNFNNL
jgi:hypothetical protein